MFIPYAFLIHSYPYAWFIQTSTFPLIGYNPLVVTHHPHSSSGTLKLLSALVLTYMGSWLEVDWKYHCKSVKTHIEVCNNRVSCHLSVYLSTPPPISQNCHPSSMHWLQPLALLWEPELKLRLGGTQVLSCTWTRIKQSFTFLQIVLGFCHEYDNPKQCQATASGKLPNFW